MNFSFGFCVFETKVSDSAVTTHPKRRKEDILAVCKYN